MEKVNTVALAMAAAEREEIEARNGTLKQSSNLLAPAATNAEQKTSYESDKKRRREEAKAKRRARRDAHQSNTVAAFMQSKAALESRGRTCEKCGMGDNLLPTCCGKGGSWHGLCSSNSNAEYTWLAGYDLCNGDYRSQVTVPLKHMLEGDKMRFTPTNETNATKAANATQVALSRKRTSWSRTDPSVTVNTSSDMVNPNGTLAANSTSNSTEQQAAISEGDRFLAAEKMRADAEAEAARVYAETMKAADEEVAKELAADDEEAAGILAADGQEAARVMADDEREAAEAEKKMNADAQEGAKSVAAAGQSSQKALDEADKVAAKAMWDDAVPLAETEKASLVSEHAKVKDETFQEAAHPNITWASGDTWAKAKDVGERNVTNTAKSTPQKAPKKASETKVARSTPEKEVAKEASEKKAAEKPSEKRPMKAEEAAAQAKVTTPKKELKPKKEAKPTEETKETKPTMEDVGGRASQNTTPRNDTWVSGETWADAKEAAEAGVTKAEDSSQTTANKSIEKKAAVKVEKKIEKKTETAETAEKSAPAEPAAAATTAATAASAERRERRERPERPEKAEKTEKAQTKPASKPETTKVAPAKTQKTPGGPLGMGAKGGLPTKLSSVDQTSPSALGAQSPKALRARLDTSSEMARLDAEHRVRLEAETKAEAEADKKVPLDAQAVAKLRASNTATAPQLKQPAPKLAKPKLGWQPAWHEGSHNAAQLDGDDEAGKQRLKQALREKLRRLQASASELRSSYR